MKMRFYLFICLFAIFNTKAQVSFCPSGAQWNYNFTVYNYTAAAVAYGTENEQIKYLRDSLLNNDSCKVISTMKMYTSNNCNLNLKLTLLKQRGDTVLYRNYYTQNTWQVLYNFAAQKGQSWTNKYVSSAFMVVTNTVTVDSVSTVNINGFVLKRQLVTIKAIYPFSVVSTTATITERIGSNLFLFYNLNNSCYSIKDDFDQLLCYKDDVFGLKTFAFKSCNYSNPLGIKESVFNNEIEIFPNPFSDYLKINSKIQTSKIQISIKNILGVELLKAEEETAEPILLNLSSLSSGLYFIEIFNAGRLIAIKNLIKEN